MNIFTRAVISSFSMFLLSASVSANANNSIVSRSISPMLEHAMPAVVNIQAEGEAKAPYQPFAGQQPGQNNQAPNKSRHFVSIGSGVIIDAKHGLLLSNAHVVFETDNITVTLNDGRRFKARLVGFDTSFDVAVLQIKAEHLVDIPLGDSSKLNVGDFVATIGSPFNLKQTVTSGIVSALHRSVQMEGYEDFIQTDASINVGSSGGALVNADGQLVGINTAILAPDGGNIGIGFAIPINLAKNVMEQILKYGQLERGLLGVLIQPLTPDLAAGFGVPTEKGALVSQVNPDSPAEQVGIKEGDIIQSVNGVKMDNASQIRNTIGLSRPGTTLSLGILRKGNQQVIKVKVVSEKEYRDATDKQEGTILSGVSFASFDQETDISGHTKRIKGVQVDFVDENSDAWSANLREGDVIIAANQMAITSLNDLEKLLAQNPKTVVLHVLRDDGAVFIAIP